MDITYRLQGVTFEWDEQKARGNVEKHGVTFEEAAEVFFDPFCRGGDALVGGEERALMPLAQKGSSMYDPDEVTNIRLRPARRNTSGCRSQRKRWSSYGAWRSLGTWSPTSC